MNYFGEIISGVVLIIVAIIEAKACRDRKNQKEEKERMERRAARRAEENRLSIQMENANLQLSMITAKKVMNQETNGDVDEALVAAKKAAEAYESFLDEVATEQIAKL